MHIVLTVTLMLWFVQKCTVTRMLWFNRVERRHTHHVDIVHRILTVTQMLWFEQREIPTRC